MEKTQVATVKGGSVHPRVIGKRKVGKQTIKVAEIPVKIKGGFIGLNEPAAKELHIKTNIPYNEIVEYKGERKSTKKDTIRHELIEEHLMRYGKLKYHQAHKVALRFEDTNTTPKEALKWYRKQQKAK